MSENFDINDNTDLKKALDTIKRGDNKGEVNMAVSAICYN